MRGAVLLAVAVDLALSLLDLLLGESLLSYYVLALGIKAERDHCVELVAVAHQLVSIVSIVA